MKNTPLKGHKNTLLEEELQKLGHRRYTTADHIDHIAKHYYQKTRRGITYSHLIKERIASSKAQAQNTLKRFRIMKVLFTIENKRPQEYYPMSIKSEIMKAILSENSPVDPTGVKQHSTSISQLSDLQIEQTLEAYVLPLLPDVPLDLHNIHFKFKINSEYDNDLALTPYKKNRGKFCEEPIGNYLVRFVIYLNGTIEVDIGSSNRPFKLVTEDDWARVLVYFGEVKAFVKDILNDPHERVVPDVLNWEVTECDINKDIPAGDSFHSTGLKIQLKHFNHLFRIYFKAMGRNTVCRVEKSVTPHKPVIGVIDEIFNYNNKSLWPAKTR